MAAICSANCNLMVGDMIHEVSGDILLSQAAAIAHGVAPGDHFNQGLALALRERWPAMAKDFRHWCHQSHPKPGTSWIWSGPSGARIICLLTQDESLEGHGHSHGHGQKGGKAHVEHVNHALKDLRHVIEKEGITSLALPRLATGVGGLDWMEVKPLIKHHLGDLKIPIFVYVEYHAGKAAEETLQASR
jgi:O-acetyl-ADP-ribose deacetylase (regulator of RNase III)